MKSSIGLADDNGRLWRDHRRFASQVLRDYAKSGMEYRIQQEIRYLIARIDETSGRPLNAGKLLTPSMSNNICHLVFGHRYDYNDPKRQAMDKMLDEACKVFSVIGVMAMAPAWFCKLVFRASDFGNKRQFDIAFDIFEYDF